MSDRPTTENQQPAGPVTARWAALVYGGVSLVGAVIFLAVTTLTGSYPAVARFGGAAWVFILLMIVLMPVVIPRARRRRGS